MADRPLMGTLEPDNFILGSTSADRIMIGSNLIWEPDTSPPPYDGPPPPFELNGPINFSATIGEAFPGGVPLEVCLVGGGGSGRDGTSVQCGGGYAGEVVIENITLPESGTVQIILGDGGAPGGSNTGNPGEQSSFADTIYAAGGAGASYEDYQGDGAEKQACGSTAYDGARVLTSWGGESSGLSNGTDGNSSEQPVKGSGAGGTTLGSPQSGGPGYIRITWNESKVKKDK